MSHNTQKARKSPFDKLSRLVVLSCSGAFAIFALYSEIYGATETSLYATIIGAAFWVLWAVLWRIDKEEWPIVGWLR